MTSSTSIPEAINITIDLESSLGRIEDEAMEDATCSDEPNCNTNTCNQSPFSQEPTEDQVCHVISVYPIDETVTEIRDRQRLSESVGKFLPPRNHQVSPGKQADWVPEDLEPVEDPGDDAFSLASEDEEPLMEMESFELERIEDPVSFFESDVAPTRSSHPNIIPFTPSYSTQDDTCLVSEC